MSSPVLWYATRATGLVAMVLVSATVVLGALTGARLVGRRWPGFAQQAVHRNVSMLAVVFLALHVLTSVLDSFVHIGWAGVVVPGVSGYEPLWVGLGAVALDAMVAVAVTSLVRHRLPAGLWRAVHWAGYLSWPLAMAHAFGAGTDMAEGWASILGALCIAAVVGAVAVRIVSWRHGVRTALAAAPVLATTGPKHLRRT